MKRPPKQLFKIFSAESWSKITPRVKKNANNFTEEMDAE